MTGLKESISSMSDVMMTPRKKPTAFKLKKPDGNKTSGVIVEFDDGSSCYLHQIVESEVKP